MLCLFSTKTTLLLWLKLVEIGDPIAVEDVFTITLVARELMMGDSHGYFSYTLDVVVNERHLLLT